MYSLPLLDCKIWIHHPVSFSTSALNSLNFSKASLLANRMYTNIFLKQLSIKLIKYHFPNNKGVFISLQMSEWIKSRMPEAHFIHSYRKGCQVTLFAMQSSQNSSECYRSECWKSGNLFTMPLLTRISRLVLPI